MKALLIQHKALPILLEHESISSNQQLLAALLNTSKALAEAISELVGSVSLRFQVVSKATLKCVPGLSDFISKRGHILRACDICLAYDDYEVSQLIERTLALGLREAAKSPPGLHIQCYEHHGGTSSVLHILAQLPAQHLQHLHLCLDDDSTDLQRVCPALASLTGLTSLTLRSGAVQLLLPALSGLTDLHTLQLSTLADTHHLNNLPTSLEALHLAVAPLDDSDSDDDSHRVTGQQDTELVRLAYLQQCTAITGGMCPLVLTSGQDQLPPSLQALAVELRSNAASEALTHLTALTGLTLLEPRLTSKTHLEALATSLTGLQQLQVDYSVIVWLDSFAHGFGGLPVNSLRFKLVPTEVDHLLVSAAVVPNLTKLAGSLTELHLAGVRGRGFCIVEATPRRLAGVLQQLTGLKKLVLLDLELQDIIEDDDVDHDEHMNMSTLSTAISRLPHLTSLSTSLSAAAERRGQGRHPAAELTAATALRHLSLPFCALDDLALVALACELTNLSSLDVSGNGVTNAALPAIAAQLPQLTSLGLAETLVTDAGLQYLSKLRFLRGLSVPEAVSEEAVAKALRRPGGVSIREDGVVEMHS